MKKLTLSNLGKALRNDSSTEWKFKIESGSKVFVFGNAKVFSTKSLTFVTNALKTMGLTFSHFEVIPRAVNSVNPNNLWLYIKLNFVMMV